MHVRNKKERIILFLILKELLDTATVIADGQFPAGLKTRKKSFFCVTHNI